ncbi:cbb3-type cytochrome c oxidase subunit I [Rhodoferax sp.]|uniref:cbb3-type cytochrome c oxidase subunit I n=1 Tax=Rhodoferax sp. TaxID=50421 RepID=UPI0027712071|nr:cbb3-type cytochrome c oxidase subunit I [Rhodoferax sp.]
MTGDSIDCGAQDAGPGAPSLETTPLSAKFELQVADGERGQLAAAWLWLAIAALLISGVFSILLVAARTPFIQGLMPGVDFFKVALVVHVDMSVLVWFAAFTSVLWSMAGSQRWLGLAWAAWLLAALGTVGMAIAPFVNPGTPIMANYVPVIDSTLFLWGLTVFGAGFGLTALRALAVPQRVGLHLAADGALRFGLNTAAVAAAMALLALGWSWYKVPVTLDTRTYYELLFWGPGHVIQFCWSLIMLIAWLWLASLSGARLPLSPRVVVILFGIGLATVFTTAPIYLAFDVTSVEHQKLFTWQMRFGGGLAIVPVALAVLIGLFRRERAAQATHPCYVALLASLLLFGAGGVIGFMIEGSDVRVPAHYHGSIVGITLALMGLTYALLPRLGFAAPLPRMATWQPAVYGVGQLMHITGLVWSGGYGVQRKVAGAEQVLRSNSEVAGMALMGAGGLVAVIGGLIFAIVVLRLLRAGRA